MFVTVPTDENILWQEWAWWHWQNETGFTMENQEALKSIQRICEDQYKHGHPCIIGHMIMMFDRMVME